MVQKLTIRQQRTLDEKEQLDGYLVAIRRHIESPAFHLEADNEKVRLLTQRAHMQSYSDVLGERIQTIMEGIGDG